MWRSWTAPERSTASQLPDACVHDPEHALWPAGWDRLPYSQAVRPVGDDFKNSASAQEVICEQRVRPSQRNAAGAAATLASCS